MRDYTPHLFKSIQAALTAGKEILDVYESDFAVEYKADNSPLTRADRNSHDILVASLAEFDIPVLSEEGREIPYTERKKWEQLWIIDPLDGTKEFIKRNGEFTVNIALVEYVEPILGVVYAPIKRVLYFASKNTGSFKLENPLECNWIKEDVDSRDYAHLMREIIDSAVRLPIGKPDDALFTIVGSRSHASPDLKKFVEDKRQEHGEVDFISAGSSLKICLVADGTADLYPRMGPTCEWDTAAGQAIAEYAGAKMLNFKTGEPLKYNRDDILNPWFIVRR